MSQLSQAIALAADVHEHHSDKGGYPYILHPLRVMEDAMRVEDGSERVGVVAVLHDVLEDNDKYEPTQLRRMIQERLDPLGAFGLVPGALPILQFLDILTKGVGEDYLGEYIPRIIESQTWCTTIKMADLRDNMTILRQPNLEDRDLQRIQKYHMAYRMLRDAR